MRRLLFTVVAVVGWAGMTLGPSALGGKSPAVPLTVDPTSGPPGTTVTVTGGDCGLIGAGLRASNGTGAYIPGTGQLIVFVDGWPEPFQSQGFEGGFNDEDGIATATFQVPDVTPGEYTIEAECVDTCLVSTAGNSIVATGCAVGGDTSSASSTPSAIGPYPSGTPFTVTSATSTVTPPVQAEPTTTG